MRGYEQLVETLSDAGVKYAFGLPGHGLIPATEYMYESGKMRFIAIRHEQVAAAMAEGVARVTGTPAACIAGAGPSAANLIIGVANAYRASYPMLAITGNTSRANLGRDVLNEWNQLEVFRTVTKKGIQITHPELLASQLRLALLTSVSGRPGPVHVDIPGDVSAAEVKPPSRSGRLYLGPTRVEPKSGLVRTAVEMIKRAQSPVIIAGGGALASEAGARLKELVELMAIPVAVAGARGIIPDDHPLCFGPVGVWGFTGTNNLVRAADLIIGLGFRFSDDTTMGWTTISKDARIIQVDIDPTEIGRQYDVDLAVLADVDAFLGQLLRAIRRDARRGKGWPKEKLQALQSALRRERERFVSGPFESQVVDKRLIVREVQNQMEEDAIIAMGTGIHTRYASRIISRSPRSVLRSGPYAGMGFGYPAAMGAKLAKPDRQVICLDGDGDFLMTVQDIETAVREDLPFVTIIFDNSSYGAYKLFGKDKAKKIGVEFNNPDFVKLAESFGAVGARVTRSSEFGPVLKEMLKSDKPSIIDAVVSLETNLPWY